MEQAVAVGWYVDMQQGLQNIKPAATGKSHVT
jgi:hypothetical protein